MNLLATEYLYNLRQDVTAQYRSHITCLSERYGHASWRRALPYRCHFVPVRSSCAGHRMACSRAFATTKKQASNIVLTALGGYVIGLLPLPEQTHDMT
jgi:hypothetical protein